MLLEGQGRVSVIFVTPEPGPMSGSWTTLLPGSRSGAALAHRTFCNDGDALYPRCGHCSDHLAHVGLLST